MKNFDLIEGKMYKCKLSFRPMLVVNNIKQACLDEEGKTQYHSTVIAAFYNKVTGYVEQQELYEGQVQEL
jgi:hypothetical protein